MKLPTFQGIGNEDPSRFWFVINFVWDTRRITDENLKKAMQVSALQDHVLTWYIMHSTDNPNEGLAVIQDALNKDFG